MFRHTDEVCYGQAQHRSQGFKWRRWCEERIFSGETNFPGHQAAPIVWLFVITFINVNPFDGNRRSARFLVRLFPRPEVPYILRSKVFEFLVPRGLHKLRD